MTWRIQLDDDIYKDDDTSPFITYGDDGITTIRMESSTKIWDITIDDAGVLVSTEYVPAVGFSPGLLLALSTLT